MTQHRDGGTVLTWNDNIMGHPSLVIRKSTETIADRLIRLPEVMRCVGLSRPAIYKHIAAGTFPRPIKIGSASAWVGSEISGWIDARISEREGARR
jgi:prophage regulatory protein